ncbi:zinc finger protein 346-like [Stegodyphus dumicola]|uniref:zinc finger protein 346-like n=1 Tax=Stegodyphus dumicola TaxID=202533 RepID=UPI0015A92F9F|nr:zinc finger protein 346-like [Stegodyphus dumicola]
MATKGNNPIDQDSQKNCEEKSLEARSRLHPKNKDDDLNTCDICESICVGIINYNLHLAGKKHRKMENKIKLMKEIRKGGTLSEPEHVDKKNLLLNDLNVDKKFTSSGIRCDICNMKCSGPEAFTQHLAGNSHKKKLAKQEYIKKHAALKNISGYYSCNICEKEFSGPFCYQKHLESISHLKRKENLEELSKLSDPIINPKESRNLQCRSCKKRFSGIIPFNIHLKSAAHKKSVRKSAILTELQTKHPELVMRPAVDRDNSKVEDMLVCTVCHVGFSGPESAVSHFRSEKHVKKTKLKRLSNKPTKEINTNSDFKQLNAEPAGSFDNMVHREYDLLDDR